MKPIEEYLPREEDKCGHPIQYVHSSAALAAVRAALLDAAKETIEAVNDTGLQYFPQDANARLGPIYRKLSEIEQLARGGAPISLAGIAPDFTDGKESAEYIKDRWKPSDPTIEQRLATVEAKLKNLELAMVPLILSHCAVQPEEK